MIRADRVMQGSEESHIALAREYLRLLQLGDQETADAVLREICENTGVGMIGDAVYAEVGKLTREMHDSINHFVEQERMQTVMSEEMPDARARLNHVIDMTEQSAHTTMEAVETCTPLLATLTTRASDLQKLLHTYFARCDESNGLKLMQEEITDFISRVNTDSARVNAALNDIMMAQGYQDLTGQVIQRVITLVQEVEHGLIAILKLHNEQTAQSVERTEDKEGDRVGHGPAVPGVGNKDVMQSQDDVDDLLSSLGF